MEPHNVPEDEIAATLQTSRELGPEYDEAVAAALARRIDENLDARIRARISEELAVRRPVAPAPGPHTPPSGSGATAVGVTAFFSLLFGAPSTGMVAGDAGIGGVALMWLGIVVLNLIVFFASRR